MKKKTGVVRRKDKKGNSYYISLSTKKRTSKSRWKAYRTKVRNEKTIRKEFTDSFFEESKKVAPYQFRYDYPSLIDKYFSEEEKEFLKEDYTPEEKKIFFNELTSTPTKETYSIYSDIKEEITNSGKFGGETIYEIIDEKGIYLTGIYLEYNIKSKIDSKDAA
jgi:hypothetical protein